MKERKKKKQPIFRSFILVTAFSHYAVFLILFFLLIFIFARDRLNEPLRDKCLYCYAIYSNFFKAARRLSRDRTAERAKRTADWIAEENKRGKKIQRNIYIYVYIISVLIIFRILSAAYLISRVWCTVASTGIRINIVHFAYTKTERRKKQKGQTD